MKPLLIIIALVVPLFADQTADDNEKAITVARKYVTSEGLTHEIKDKGVSQWVGIGKEIGIATKEGLESVVDVSNKFGETKVGNFVMLMVAWHIIGHQLLGIFLGLPIWVAGVALWWNVMKRLFWGRRVITKKNEDKSVEYGSQVYEWDSGDAKNVAAIATTVFICVWCVVWIVVTFSR